MTRPDVGRLVKAGLLIFLLVIGGVGSVVLFFAYQAQVRQVQSLQQELAESQRRAEQLDAEKRELHQVLEGLLKERKTAEDRVATLSKQLSSVTADLEQSRQVLQALQGRYETATAERDKTQAQLAGVTGQRDDIKKDVQRLEQDKANLQRSVSRLRERLTWFDRDYRQVVDKLAQKEAADRQVKTTIAQLNPSDTAPSPSVSAVRPSASAMAGTVELPPIIVRKDQAGQAIPVRGRILEINEAHNFIIVDKGGMDGVRVGMLFDVLRGGAPVGRATVIRVRPKISACETIRAKTSGTLQAGDLAVQSAQ